MAPHFQTRAQWRGGLRHVLPLIAVTLGLAHWSMAGADTLSPQAVARAAMAEPDQHAHPENPAKAKEHEAVLNLVPRGEATHVAVRDGGWFDPATWNDGAVPGADARVLVPADRTVRYGGQSDVSLFTVRIDGALVFATDRDTSLTLDTLVVAPGGQLDIGSSNVPVQSDVRARILIADNGDIDVAWDPLLLSRGVVSHGRVVIHGAPKAAFLKVAHAPMAGHGAVDMAGAPDGWMVGDTIVISGTHKRGWAWDEDGNAHRHYPSEDEVRTITAVEGPSVTLDRPLLYDHDTPRADLFAYVANMTRNVLVASKAGKQTPPHHRGHVMFMHNDDVDVRYAQFLDLGRTDKSREAFDIGALPLVAPDSNIKGRYSVHFHHTGLTDRLHPVVALGNTVFGSPGWGFVHHSSNADFVENVAYNVFGAAFAAEDGDETGIWLRNMAIRSQGYDWGDWSVKTGVDRHDNGRTGDGFFFAGRLVEAAENVAANTTHGFVWMHRSAPSGPAVASLHHPEIAYGTPAVEPARAPIQGFRDNEAFGTQVGLIVMKANPAQGHDVRSMMLGFRNWETSQGVDISYSGHYTFDDFDLIATTGDDALGPFAGIRMGTDVFDVVLNRLKVQDFRMGVEHRQDYTFVMPDTEIHIALVAPEIIGAKVSFLGFNSARHSIIPRSGLAGRPGGAQLSFQQDEQTIRDGQGLALRGTKIDALGRVSRQNSADGQTIPPWLVHDLLKDTGYFTTSDGGRIALIPDLVSDRATGDLLKFSYKVSLDMGEDVLEGIGATNHGSYAPQITAQKPADDAFRLRRDESAEIDLLANDDLAGYPARLAGVTDPVHGEVVAADDGQVIYRPNSGFTGTDHFKYWLSDGQGGYAAAQVTIRVE